jgi:hypothetical protein
MTDVDLKIDGLKRLFKALKDKPPIARVGILGNSAARSNEGDGPNNATIGAYHEFGTSSLPVRSFLRVPITENLQKAMDNSGAFTPEAFSQVMKQKSLRPWVEKLAILAEGIVADAFDTGGFGKWPASDMRYKKVRQTLVETQQLRNSITSEVKDSA